MQNTTNFGLRKPDYTDPADVQDLNFNADIIDTQLKSNADAVSTAVGNLQGQITLNKGTMDGHINNGDLHVTSVLKANYNLAYDRNHMPHTTGIADGRTSPNIANLNPAQVRSLSATFYSNSRSTMRYFVTMSSFGFTSADFGVITITVPWQDLSGGSIIQRLESNGKVWQRHSTSDTAWSAFYVIVDPTVDVNQLFQSVSNGKASVANAITAKGVSTSTTATFATMATNISLITTGNFASGSTVSPSNNHNFLTAGGTTVSSPAVTISGLSFKPNLIIMSNGQDVSNYQNYYSLNAASLTPGTDQVQTFTILGEVSQSTISTFRANGADGYVINGGFRIPCRQTGLTYQWFAFA